MKGKTIIRLIIRTFMAFAIIAFVWILALVFSMF